MRRCLLLTTSVLLAAASATTTTSTSTKTTSANQPQRLRGVRRALQWDWPSVFPDIEEGEEEIEGGVTDIPLKKMTEQEMRAGGGDAGLVEGKPRQGVWGWANEVEEEEEHHVNIPRTATLGGERPAKVVLPEAFPTKSEEDDEKLWPMILMLHGYGSDASYHDHFLGLSERVNQHGGFLALMPNGTLNSQGRHFWNGLQCCDFDNQGPDDIAYLTGLVAEAISTLKVDPKRVYMLGHSNGGAMTQILACDYAELFAAVASVTPGEIPSVCAPSHPVSVLEVCASKDPIVKLDLCASIMGNWTMNDGCAMKPTFEETRDYDCDASLPVDDNVGYDQWRDHNCMLSGNETEVSGWTCEGGSSVEFWWMRGAVHNPAFSSQWSDDVVAWLMSKTYVEA